MHKHLRDKKYSIKFENLHHWNNVSFTLPATAKSPPHPHWEVVHKEDGRIVRETVSMVFNFVVLDEERTIEKTFLKELFMAKHYDCKFNLTVTLKTRIFKRIWKIHNATMLEPIHFDNKYLFVRVVYPENSGYVV